jgi:LacI family transcriptional regulator
VTIKDLARIAGVSHSTVSRSLNDSPLISDETKNRIKKLALQYDFDLNASAQSLSTRKTGTIGIICPEVYDEKRYSFYIAQLLDTIRYKLDGFLYDSIITFPKNSQTGESNIKRLIRRKKVDGLLLIIPKIDEEDLEIIQKSRLPHIYVHFKHSHEREESSEYIYADHFHGGYIAAEFLLDRGSRRFCLFSGDQADSEYYERTAGFKAALKDRGVNPDEVTLFVGESSFEFGFQGVHEHFEELRKADGVFAHSDIIAFGIIEALREKKIEVPGDTNLIGYDDIILGQYLQPRLTTVHQPKEIQAEMSIKRLFSLIREEGEEKKLQRVIEPIVVEGGTCVVHDTVRRTV